MKPASRILALRLPHLLAQAETRLNPALRGRAFVLAAGDGPRSPVLGVSPELAGGGGGLRTGEPLARWLHRLPGLLVVVSRADRARPLLDEARAGLEALAPQVRELPGAVFQLELQEGGLLHADARGQARRLQEELRERGLTTAAGLGASPLAARLLARRAGPGELHVASAGDVRALESLPLAGLPGLPANLPAQLARVGVRFVGEARELARELGREDWGRRFGRAGMALADLLAELEGPITVDGAAGRLQARRRLEVDTADPARLDQALLDLLEDLHARAREENLGAVRLALRLVWNDGRITGRERRVQAGPRESRRQGLRRVGRALLQAQLESRRLRVRELQGGLVLEAPREQLALFAAADREPRERRLDEALGLLRRRWGFHVVTLGARAAAPTPQEATEGVVP